MMMKHMLTISLAAGILLTATTDLRAADLVPYGHRDFLPTPARPIGYLGDGSGTFPGATPPLSFRAGTVRQWAGKDKRGRDRTCLDLVDDKRVNVRWFVPTPSWGNNPPLVVGDKVYCFGEPDWVFCFALEDGELLWQRRFSPWHAAGLETPLADRVRDLYGVWLTLKITIGKFSWGSQYAVDEMMGVYLDTCHERIVRRLAEIDPDGDYAAAAKAMRAYLLDYRKRAKGWDPAKEKPNASGKENGHFSHRKCGQLREMVKQRMQELAPITKEICLKQVWQNFMGHVMQSPVSDGRHLYVQMGQGQVGALHLKDGTVAWQTLLKATPDVTKVRSPLLADGVLVCPVTGDPITALDASTGTKLWEAPTPGVGCRQVASDCIIRLGPERRGFVVTTHCNIIDVKTGEVAGVLPYAQDAPQSKGKPAKVDDGPSMFPVPHPDGGVVLMKTGYGNKTLGYRVWLQADQVRVDKLYQIKAVSGNYKDDCAGIVISPADPRVVLSVGRAVDPLTGEDLAARLPARMGGAIMAGRYAIAPQCHHTHGLPPVDSRWGGRGEAGKAMNRFAIVDMQDPAKPTLVSDDNLLGGTMGPRSIEAEALIPELWAMNAFYHCKGGKPAHFYYLDRGMVAHGSDIIVRSIPGLWCLGTP